MTRIRSGSSVSLALLFAGLAGCSGGASSGTPAPVPPSVSLVAPATLCQATSTVVAVTGTDFAPGATVSWVDVNTGATIAASSVTVASATSLTATFPGGAATAGQTLDLKVSNGPGASAASPVNQDVIPSPQLYLVDGPAAYGGIGTPATAYGLAPAPVTGFALIDGANGAHPIPFTAGPGAASGTQYEIVVPSGTAAGSYGLRVTDTSGCTRTLAQPVTVAAGPTLTLDAISPTSVDTARSVWVELKAPAATFVGDPRVYLQPASGAAVRVRDVVFVDSATVELRVPAGLAAGKYDVVAIDPDGTVGVLAAALTAGTLPSIASVTPSSIANSTAQGVTIAGANFAMGAGVAMSCHDAAGAAQPSPAITIASTTATSIGMTVDTTSLPGGSICRVALTNPDGTSTRGGPVAVLDPNLTPSAFIAGPSLNVARRGPGAVTASIPDHGRIVYVVGGDDGTFAGGRSTVESAWVQDDSSLSPWSVQRSGLPVPLTMSGVVAAGPFVYALGGYDGNTLAPTNAVYRARVLDPAAGPVVDGHSLELVQGGGLAAGRWYYEVSAVFPANDVENPDGESLAANARTVIVPAASAGSFGVVIGWTAVPGAAGYRVYRTSAPNAPEGSATLLATVPGTATTYTDTGAAAPDGTTSPLPVGSLGNWHGAGTLNTPRFQHAAAVVPDGAGNYHLYALGGRADMMTALSSVEFATTAMTGGSQSLGPFAISTSMSQARHSLGTWAVGADESPFAGGNVYLYAGGGMTGMGSMASSMEVSLVGASGDLGAWSALGTFPNVAGYAAIAATGGGIVTFGGAGGMASTTGHQAYFTSPAPNLGPWQSSPINMSTPCVYAPAASIPGVSYVIGGYNGMMPAASGVQYLYR